MSFDPPSSAGRVLKHVVVETQHRQIGVSQTSSNPSTPSRRDTVKPSPVDQAQKEAEALLSQAQQQARDILQKARQQAGQMLAEAEDKVKTLELQATERGLNTGQQQARAEVEKSLQHLQQVIEAAQNDRTRLLANTEQEVVELVLAITRRILKIEPLINEQVLIRVAREALSHLGQQLEVLIEVHPEDVELLHFSLSQIEDLALDIVIEPREDISIGGCRIRSQSGNVDANLQTQFDAIAQSFLALAEGDSHESNTDLS